MRAAARVLEKRREGTLGFPLSRPPPEALRLPTPSLHTRKPRLLHHTAGITTFDSTSDSLARLRLRANERTIERFLKNEKRQAPRPSSPASPPHSARKHARTPDPSSAPDLRPFCPAVPRARASPARASLSKDKRARACGVRPGAVQTVAARSPPSKEEKGPPPPEGLAARALAADSSSRGRSPARRNQQQHQQQKDPFSSLSKAD